MERVIKMNLKVVEHVGWIDLEFCDDFEHEVASINVDERYRMPQNSVDGNHALVLMGFLKFKPINVRKNQL
jgi:hypothetical protein